MDWVLATVNECRGDLRHCCKHKRPCYALGSIRVSGIRDNYGYHVIESFSAVLLWDT